MSKKTEMIGFKTDPETKRKLEQIAREEDRSLSYIISRIIKQYLDQLQ